jgi:hypothetical protein
MLRVLSDVARDYSLGLEQRAADGDLIGTEKR